MEEVLSKVYYAVVGNDFVGEYVVNRYNERREAEKDAERLNKRPDLINVHFTVRRVEA